MNLESDIGDVETEDDEPIKKTPETKQMLPPQINTKAGIHFLTLIIICT